MRRLGTLITTITIALSGLVISPANAATQDCGAGGNFTITGDRVSAVSSDCTGSVIIPEGVVDFAPYVFSGLGITGFSIPSSYLGWSVHSDFDHLRDLRGISVSESNPNFSSDSSGVLFSKDKKSVLLYPQGKTESSYEIPSGVQQIGNTAFYYAQFTSVKIPGTVTSIRSSAFLGSSLTSVVIPPSVTTMEYYAFRANRNLATVTFAGNPPGPANENYVFQGVTAFAQFSAAKTSAWNSKLAEYNRSDVGQAQLTARPGNIYNFYTDDADGSAPISQWKPTGDTDENKWTAPTTTAIRTGFTFSGWNTQVDGSGDSYSAGNSYANVGDLNLFAQISINDGPYRCSTGLPQQGGDTSASYLINRGVVSEGYSCTGAVVIPVGVTAIGAAAFQGDTAMTSISIADSVTSIGAYAFAATSMPSIAIPASVARIGAHAFGGAGVTSVTIPMGVKTIEDYTFYDATSLTSITIPESVTSIGNSAFKFSTALTSITIPASVTSIGQYAFSEATSLKDVNVQGSAPSVGLGAFAPVAYEARVYVAADATGFGEDDYWNGLIVARLGTYTVTYNYNSATGDNSVASGSFTTFGAAITLPTPTRTGYTFGGWYSDAGLVFKIGESGASYSPTGAKLAKEIYARWTSNSTKAVAVKKPTIVGKAKVSKKLTAKKGTWIGNPTPVITYQWYACGKKISVAKSVVPKSCKMISRKTKSTLKLAKAQRGKFITVLVTGTSAATSATKWLAKSTTKVK